MWSHSGRLQQKQPNTDERSDTNLNRISTKDGHDDSHRGYFPHKMESRFHLQHIHSTGPSEHFNPTNVRVHVRLNRPEDDSTIPSSSTTLSSPQSDFHVLWRSRDHRKGRGSLAVRRAVPLGQQQTHIRVASTVQSAKEIALGCLKMVTTFPCSNLAFWSGFAYTWGSVLFIISAALCWVPQAFPNHRYPQGLVVYAVPLTTFVGVLLFQLGAMAAWLEAVNDGSFHGSAVQRLLEGHKDDEKKLANEKIHTLFAHANPLHRPSNENKVVEAVERQVHPEAGRQTGGIPECPGTIHPLGRASTPRRGRTDLGHEYTKWRWWPTWQALRTHHVYEIGFLACSIQAIGVTMFCWTGFVLLPGIFNHLGGRWGQFGAYWIVQIIASMLFVIASIMFSLETQEKWWMPQLNVLGWWVGFFALLGSIGFELCAVFGSIGYAWATYQSSLSSLWGSTFFLISSLFQWYEGVNKHPVAEMLIRPEEMKLSQVHPI